MKKEREIMRTIEVEKLKKKTMKDKIIKGEEVMSINYELIGYLKGKVFDINEEIIKLNDVLEELKTTGGFKEMERITDELSFLQFEKESIQEKINKEINKKEVSIVEKFNEVFEIYFEDEEEIEFLYERDKTQNKRFIFLTLDMLKEIPLKKYNPDKIGFVIVKDEGEYWETPFKDNKYKGFLISNYGRLAELKEDGRVIKRTIRYTDNGYLYYDFIDKQGDRHQIQAHKIVIDTFVGRGEGKDFETIDHINNMPGDNRLKNLEYVSRSENLKRAHRDNLFDYKNKTILSKDEKKELVKKYEKGDTTYKILSEEYDISYYTVYSIVKKSRENNIM